MNATQKKAMEKLERSLESKTESKQYQQQLYKIVEPKDDIVFKQLNKKKQFEYGYNKELDIVVISKTGQVGEIYEISGLQIGIPPVAEDLHARSDIKKEQYWEQIEVPKFIKQTKSVYQFTQSNSEAVKLQWSNYINTEFDRRSDGFWFLNNGEPTYVTGSHYMYLQWTKTDAEFIEYRKSNQLFFFFWEACKADKRSYGMCYLKNRRSGFSFMASAETVNLATKTKDAKFGILSKTGFDAKEMFVNKVVPIATNYPFFFKPLQDGQDKPKKEISYKKPSKKLTERTLKAFKEEDGLGEGLETTIDYMNTGDYSYDGQALAMLTQDEAGKWEKPANIKQNWIRTRTCLQKGRRITGKCMMGSTAGALDTGGEEFKEIYENSDLREAKRDANGNTPSGLYALFIPMEWNVEGYIDRYGYPVFNNPEEYTEDAWGEEIDKGVIDWWKNRAEGLKVSPDELNGFYRQYPMTQDQAFRDEAEGSIFNITRIQDQIDYNRDLERDGVVTRGNFMWKNNEQDTEVEFRPNKDGRFHITKVLPSPLLNHVVVRKGIKYPGNEHIGSFGCDPYDISGTVGKGSNGALHGLSKTHMEEFPMNHFFLEYISRPPTAEIFYEDVLMAIHYYGMPILVENNRPGLLKYIARRGYRGFSMNAPHKKFSKLSTSERELGGLPMSGPQVLHDHMNAINTYIEYNVGWDLNSDEMGQMYFRRTLLDWSSFKPDKRTEYDATISSGLAIMANQRLNYKPKVGRVEREKIKINMGQRGPNGKLIFGNDR